MFLCVLDSGLDKILGVSNTLQLNWYMEKATESLKETVDSLLFQMNGSLWDCTKSVIYGWATAWNNTILNKAPFISKALYTIDIQKTLQQPLRLKGEEKKDKHLSGKCQAPETGKELFSIQSNFVNPT